MTAAVREKSNTYASPLIEPERELFPDRKRWTVEECRRLAEAGFLNGRYELIDGEIIEKMPHNPPHRIVLILIANWLISLFGKLRVQEQFPINITGALGRNNEPEPDIAVTREATTAYVTSHPRPEDLILAVEVAATSLAFDRGTKARLYARTGVREYWIADVNDRCIHVFRDPDGDNYRTYSRHSFDATVSIDERPDAVVNVAEFFPSFVETAD